MTTVLETKTDKVGDLDLDVRIAAVTGTEEGDSKYTSPNLTWGVQSFCPTCC